jgi:hypothetical protein
LSFRQTLLRSWRNPDFLSLDQRLAFRRGDVTKGGWRVADKRNGLAGREEGFYEFDRFSVLGEIPHGTVPTGVVNRVKVRLRDAVQTHRGRELCVGRRISLEAAGELGLILRLGTRRIERRLPTVRRSEHDFHASVFECVCQIIRF